MKLLKFFLQLALVSALASFTTASQTGDGITAGDKHHPDVDGMVPNNMPGETTRGLRLVEEADLAEDDEMLNQDVETNEEADLTENDADKEEDGRSLGQTTSSSTNTLSRLHSGCSGWWRVKRPDCAAATHRACKAYGYQVGIRQLHNPRGIYATCLRPNWFGHVHISLLGFYHSGCNLHNTQSSDCVAAAHRVCKKKGYNMGIIQEVGSENVAMGCFRAGRMYVERKSFLQNCPSVEDCFDEASHYCRSRGWAGGLPQEHTGSKVAFGCYRGAYKFFSFR